MSCGKKLVPVRLAAWAGLRWPSAAGPSSVLTAEDRLGSLRAAYHAEADHAAQRAIVAEAVEINTRLQAAVQAKLARLAAFQAELEAKAARYAASLAGLQPPGHATAPDAVPSGG